MTSAGADFYYHPDELGSILALTDSAGATQWSYRYEPYGKAKTETKVNRNAPVNPMRFTGTYLDASGQNHLRARQYDAATGEFTSPDSAGSASAYGYAEANPMVYVDPLGTDVRDFVRGLRAASGYVMAVGGLVAVAVACTPLVTCAPAVATYTAVLVGVAGTVHAGTSIALAYDSCARGKGSCVSDVVQAGLSVGVGGYGYSIMRLPIAPRALADDAISGRNLGRQLASEQQLGEAGRAIAGAGTGVTLRDAPRLAQQYGGSADDWLKMSSSSYRGTDGLQFETHWYQNIRTGQGVEFKTKMGYGG